jgi:hypothetical protein
VKYVQFPVTSFHEPVIGKDTVLPSVPGRFLGVLDDKILHGASLIALGTAGSYFLGVPLVAARNGNDQDGRTYISVVGARDTNGNTGSCTAVVMVPHDQGK